MCWISVLFLNVNTANKSSFSAPVTTGTFEKGAPGTSFPVMIPGRNRLQITLVESEWPQHHVIPIPSRLPRCIKCTNKRLLQAQKAETRTNKQLTSASLHLSSAMDMTSLLLMTESSIEVSFNRGPLRLRTFSRIDSWWEKKHKNIVKIKEK